MRLQLKFHAHSISTHTHRPLVSGADRAICQDVAPRLTRPPRNGITLTRYPPPHTPTRRRWWSNGRRRRRARLGKAADHAAEAEVRDDCLVL